MTPNEYQREAHGFAKYGGNPTYPFAGLAEEAGEACGKFAKYIRKHDGRFPVTCANEWSASLDADNAEFRENLKKELGDVLWMVAECATLYGLSLDEIMFGNIAKLADRARRGVIVGEGDNR